MVLKSILLSILLLSSYCCIGQRRDTLPLNIPPISLAGDNQVITKPYTTLQGEGIDPDGVIVAYFWTQVWGERVTIKEPTKRKTVIYGLSKEGSYIFKFRVTDNMSETEQDNVVITKIKLL